MALKCVQTDEQCASAVRLRKARLPAFLDELRLDNLAVGEDRVDLRVQREPDGGVGVEAVPRRGSVSVVEVT